MTHDKHRLVSLVLELGLNQLPVDDKSVITPSGGTYEGKVRRIPELRVGTTASVRARPPLTHPPTHTTYLPQSYLDFPSHET